MKRSIIFLSTIIPIAITIFILSLIYTENANARVMPYCPNNRCDIRTGGENYGCLLYAEDKKCGYSGGTYTGYKQCD